MAARLNKLHSESIRSKIRTTQLLKRLDDHAHNLVEMSPSQVSAAQFLISYALPKPVQQVEQTGTLTIKWQ